MSVDQTREEYDADPARPASISYKAMKVAMRAQEVCIAELKKVGPTHEDVAHAVYVAVCRAIDGMPCERCGQLVNGTGGHGPGFCPDRRSDASSKS